MSASTGTKGLWIYFLARLFTCLALLLPFALLTWLACRAGDFIYFFFPKRRKIALENLERAFGATMSRRKKRTVARLAFQNMALSSAELFLIPKTLKDARGRFRIHNRHHMDEALQKGLGMILVVAHLGSWEYLAFLSYLTSVPLSVVVKDLHNRHFAHEITRLRRMTHTVPISKKNSIRQMVRVLKKNHIAAVLIDQWAGREGIWQDFFGHETSSTSIPARLALRLGSALVPAYCFRTSPGHYDIEIHPAVTVNGTDEHELTRKLNELLETQIKARPDQWLWMHSRWKPKPATVREAAEISDLSDAL